MAKLAKSKSNQLKSASSRLIEPWNIPTSTLSTPSSQKLMPPPARPAQSSDSVATPVQQKAPNGDAKGEDTSSAKKKRRRRGGKVGRDSFSDNTTTTSDQPTNGDPGRPAQATSKPASTMSSQAARPSISDLRPTISQEEQTVYEKEPEMFGDYAYSVAGDSHDELETPATTKTTKRDKRKKAAANTVAANDLPEEAIEEDNTHEVHLQTAHGGHEGVEKPQITSDLDQAIQLAVPAPTKLLDGRFECPFTCGKSFSSGKVARRHAREQHLESNKFQCESCGKGYARKDKYDLHIKSHAAENATSTKQSAEPAQTEKPAVNGEMPRGASAKGSAIASGSGGADNDDVFLHEEAEPEILPTHSAAIHDPVTSAESEIESEDENLNDGVSTNTTTSAVDTKDDVPMEDATGDETASTSDAEAEVSTTKSSASPVPKISAHKNALKRKRSSPSPRPISSVRKRARREATPDSPEVEESEQEQSAPSDAESSKASEANAASRNGTVDSDVEMQDSDQEIQGGESAPEPVKLSVRPKVKDKLPKAASRVKETTKKPEIASAKHTKPSGSSAPGKAKAASPQPSARRQSSMDDFVSRSRSASDANVKASSSGMKEISVNIPPRQKAKPQEKQKDQVLSSKQRPAKPKSSKGKERAREEDDGQEIIEDSEAQQRPTRRAKKTKEKLREDEEDEEVKEESETHSSDRPKATTIARRTSSLSSKPRPKVKRKSKVAARLQEDKSEEEQSETQEESGSDVDVPKRKARKPPKLSTRASTSTSGQTGRFSDEEVQILLSWRDSFCAEHDLTATEFNDVMTASMRRDKDHPWPYKFITRAEFLNEYREQLPNRERRSMNRFRERHFQNVETSPWTKDEDNELRGLVNQLGSKWVEIGQLMGRTGDAVHQRWKHKLNYGHEVKDGEWTDDEISRLEDVVEAYAKSKGTTARDDDLNIPWHAISLKVGNGRSAQQCSNRWRVNTTRRVKGRFTKVPLDDRIPGRATKLPKVESKAPKAKRKSKIPRTPSKLSQRLAGDDGTPKAKSSSQKQGSAKKVFKSAERVEDSDEEADDEKEEPEQTDIESDDQNQTSDAEEEDVSKSKSQEATSDDQQAESDNDASEQQSATASDAESNDSEANVEGRVDGDAEMKDAEDIKQEQEQDEEEDSDAGETVNQASGTGSESEPDNTSDTIEVRSPTPPPPSSRTRTRASQSQGQSPPHSQQNCSTKKKAKQPSPLKSSQPQLPSQTQKSTRTPAISKNPLRAAKTPANALSLSQLHAGTQANSSAKRTITNTVQSRVPDSVIEERPSPELSVRRRPVSSPLGMLTDGQMDVDEEEDTINVKSPLDDSFLSARSKTGLRSGSGTTDSGSDGSSSGSGSESEESPSRSRSKSESGSESEETASEDEQDTKDERSAPNASQGSFWASVNGIAKRFVPGLSQNQVQGTASQTQPSNKRRSLADALTQGAADDSDSDDE
ncbi:hypothetical protein PMZ80_004942 [Knufia obscura]|uniref:Uncharacterized protein n=2 Tax=Knufia TaxID=430999 RepID=A0AAN8IRY8_9EURO|nr:hypothetical protein PMZ80_004942 [Knufia obscura]KAK5957607.1 hypothetical protein OHC33_000794 [Knufia fluminis]